MSEFVIKDSGERKEFASGMVRDIADDKINWSLVADGPLLKRFALHLTNGAKKYAVRNWMKAEGLAEYARFKESAFRHFMQWYLGDIDEDHAAATVFNINGALYCEERLNSTAPKVGEEGSVLKEPIVDVAGKNFCASNKV